jgi:lipid-binding SYLF domain-containing protein
MENLYGMHAKSKVHTITTTTTTNNNNNNNSNNNNAPNKMKTPDRTTMEGMIMNANLILDFALLAPLKEEKRHDLVKSIPTVLFKECEGILLLRVVEAAFLVSVNVGTGLLLAHNKQDKTWSAPSAVGLTGVGWGFQGGVARKDVVLFIMDKETMRTLTGDLQFKFGPQASLTVGDVGRDVQGAFHASDKGFGATVAFSYSKGFLFGLSLQGNVVAPRVKCNDTFYERSTTPNDILFGQTTVVVPSNNKRGVQDLHRKLELLAERSSVMKTSGVVITVPTPTVEKKSFNEDYETVHTQTLEENTNWNETIIQTLSAVETSACTKEYETIQTQTGVETSTNEYEIVKHQKEDPPGTELESDIQDDIEFISRLDAMLPREGDDDTDDDEDMEFIVSSEAIEEEMKAAGVLSK